MRKKGMDLLDCIKHQRALERDAETLRLIVKHKLIVDAPRQRSETWGAISPNGEWAQAKSIHTAVRRAAKGVGR